MADYSAYASGSTEPWVVDVLCTLVRATRARHILELGAFEGLTTVELARAVAPVNGGVTAIECDPVRTALVRQRLADEGLTNVRVIEQDALEYLRNTDSAPFNFAFIDDDHAYAHVAEELRLVTKRMAPGGVIALHDVIGVFGLDRLVYQNGGVVLHTPLLHVAGGLGLISMPAFAVYDIHGNAITVTHLGHGG